MCVPMSPEELREKRNAILRHQSQMESAPFLGNDERLFWQRAEDRNRATAKLYDDLGHVPKTATALRPNSTTTSDWLAMKPWRPS